MLAACSGPRTLALRNKGYLLQVAQPCRTHPWHCQRQVLLQPCLVAQRSNVYMDLDAEEEEEEDESDFVWESVMGEGDGDPEGAEGPDQSRELAVAMARVASDTKASDVTVLHVAPLVYWTSYLVLATVTSRPQLQAILGKMERQARDEWGRAPSAVSPGRSVWEVLDYGDVVVHLFTAEQREYYDLESFYGAAEEVELPFTAEPAEATWTRQL